MWATQPNSVLGMTSQAALEGLYQRLCRQTGLDYQHVRFTPQAQSSSILIESLEISQQGQSGLYLGQITLPYQKIALDTLYPHPVFYQGQWDMPFRFIARDIEERLGWVIEPEDFIWSANGRSIDPTLDTVMDLDTIQSENHEITLTVKPTSIRFVAGTQVRIRLDAVNRKPHTSVLYPHIDTQVSDWLTVLTDESRIVSSQVPNLFNATNDEIVWGIVQRLYGLALPAQYFDCTIIQRPAPDRVVVEVAPREMLPDGSLGQYEETFQLTTDLVDPQTRLPPALYLATMESISFERLQNILLLNHGFRISPGEFAMTFQSQTQDLYPQAMIDLDNYVGDAYLVAQDHPNNLRWTLGSQVRLSFVAL